jgi:hypothetical protein
MNVSAWNKARPDKRLRAHILDFKIVEECVCDHNKPGARESGEQRADCAVDYHSKTWMSTLVPAKVIITAEPTHLASGSCPSSIHCVTHMHLGPKGKLNLMQNLLLVPLPQCKWAQHKSSSAHTPNAQITL